MRSASALVSSRKLPKLAMNGTFPNASRTFHAGGAAKTGFAPSTSSTCGDDATSASSGPGAAVASACAGVATAWPGVASAFRRKALNASGCGVKKTPPGCSTLPRMAFSLLTASALNRPLVCASGGPPIIATAGLASASVRAIRSMRRGSTPVIVCTCSGV